VPAVRLTHICIMKSIQIRPIDKIDFAKIVGHKLRLIRLSNKMTIEATALDAEMDYTQLSRIELGKINTSFYQIYKISKILKVHVSEIVKDLP
jgi:transcriptional regulator with XRE-family HTH domain